MPRLNPAKEEPEEKKPGEKKPEGAREALTSIKSYLEEFSARKLEHNFLYSSKTTREQSSGNIKSDRSALKLSTKESYFDRLSNNKGAKPPSQNRSPIFSSKDADYTRSQIESVKLKVRNRVLTVRKLCWARGSSSSRTKSSIILTG